MPTLTRGVVRAARIRPRWKRWKAILAGIALALALGSVAGGLYERHAVRRDAQRFPPPGQLVDVGGRRLHLLCIGSGRPVVLFEQAGSPTRRASNLRGRQSRGRRVSARTTAGESAGAIRDRERSRLA